MRDVKEIIYLQECIEEDSEVVEPHVETKGQGTIIPAQKMADMLDRIERSVGHHFDDIGELIEAAAKGAGVVALDSQTTRQRVERPGNPRQGQMSTAACGSCGQTAMVFD